MTIGDRSYVKLCMKIYSVCMFCAGYGYVCMSGLIVGWRIVMYGQQCHVYFYRVYFGDSFCIDIMLSEYLLTVCLHRLD